MHRTQLTEKKKKKRKRLSFLPIFSLFLFVWEEMWVETERSSSNINARWRITSPPQYELKPSKPQRSSNNMACTRFE
jgi:hypothetical protein